MGDIGTKLSNELATTIADASTAVVRVDARSRRGSSGIVWAEGVIVTADHTVERDEGIQVGLPDGRTVAATLAGRDPAVDLAVLKVDATGLAPASWLETPSLQVGNLVVAVARAGRGERAVLGMVSAHGAAWRTPAGGRIDSYLQPDLALFRGFSGSLLVDLNGRALGMNSSGLMRGKSLALPTAALKRVVAEILAHGGSQRGFLGIGTLPVDFRPPSARRPAPTPRCWSSPSNPTVQPNAPDCCWGTCS
jgi:S1-C subfamily serine protease